MTDEWRFLDECDRPAPAGWVCVAGWHEGDNADNLALPREDDPCRMIPRWWNWSAAARANRGAGSQACP